MIKVKSRFSRIYSTVESTFLLTFLILVKVSVATAAMSGPIIHPEPKCEVTVTFASTIS